MPTVCWIVPQIVPHYLLLTRWSSHSSRQRQISFLSQLGLIVWRWGGILRNLRSIFCLTDVILGGAVDRGPAQLREDELHLPGQGLHRRFHCCRGGRRRGHGPCIVELPKGVVAHQRGQLFSFSWTWSVKFWCHLIIWIESKIVNILENLKHVELHLLNGHLLLLLRHS